MTKLAPARMISTLMAIWFLAASAAQYLAGLIAQLTAAETVGGQVLDPGKALATYAHTFLIIGVWGAGAGVLCWSSAPGSSAGPTASTSRRTIRSPSRARLAPLDAASAPREQGPRCSERRTAAAALRGRPPSTRSCTTEPRLSTISGSCGLGGESLGLRFRGDERVLGQTLRPAHRQAGDLQADGWPTPTGTLWPFLPQTPTPGSKAKSSPIMVTRVRAEGPSPIRVAPFTGAVTLPSSIR